MFSDDILQGWIALVLMTFSVQILKLRLKPFYGQFYVRKDNESGNG